MSNAFDRPMERRAGSRQPCRTPVRVYLEPGQEEYSFDLDSADLAPEGVFLHTELLFPVGQWLDLELRVPGRAQPVRGRGRVVRVSPARKPPGPGVAIWLQGLSDEERSALSRTSASSVRGH